MLALCTRTAKRLAKLGFCGASWRQAQFSSAMLASSIARTAHSASRREIAPGTQVQNASHKTKLFAEGGFTLVELLITCVLIGIVGIAVAAFMTTWLDGYSQTNTRTALLDNAEQALDTITADIRLSGNADDNNRWPDLNGPGGDQYGWTSNGSTLVLAKVATDNSGDVMFSDPNNYITLKDNDVYYLSGSTLYRRTIASGENGDTAVTTCPPPGSSGCPTDTTIATGVTGFAVSYYDADENQVDPASARSIGLAITLTGKSGSDTITASYNTRMVFRNE